MKILKTLSEHQDHYCTTVQRAIDKEPRHSKVSLIEPDALFVFICTLSTGTEIWI